MESRIVSKPRYKIKQAAASFLELISNDLNDIREFEENKRGRKRIKPDEAR
jgi:hypothetical protein